MSSFKNTYEIGLAYFPRNEALVLRTPAMDPEEQAEIQGWLEDVLGSPFPMGSTFEDCLASGARLCQLMNSLWYGNTEVVRERLNRLLFSLPTLHLPPPPPHPAAVSLSDAPYIPTRHGPHSLLVPRPHPHPHPAYSFHIH